VLQLEELHVDPDDVLGKLPEDSRGVWMPMDGGRQGTGMIEAGALCLQDHPIGRAGEVGIDASRARSRTLHRKVRRRTIIPMPPE